MLAMFFLVLVALLAITALLLPLPDPNMIDPVNRLQGSSSMHFLGTDDLGRDTLSRLIWGAQWSLGTVVIATVLIMTVGVSLGVIAGFYGGLVDEVVMRIVDVFLSLPSLLLAMAIGGMLGPGFSSVLFALVGVWWASYARLVRGMVIGMRERDFLAAARALGSNDWRLITRHILPSIMPTVAVLTTIEMGDLVLAVAALGFLGIGVQAPDPEWGTMISDSRSHLLSAQRLAIYPGLAITLTVMAFNLVGDRLRDKLDPRTSGSVSSSHKSWASARLADALRNA